MRKEDKWEEVRDSSLEESQKSIVVHFFSTGVIRCASGKRREREQAFTANNKERTASESTALHDGGSVEEERK